jgi:hypothetical protein
MKIWPFLLEKSTIPDKKKKEEEEEEERERNSPPLTNHATLSGQFMGFALL